MIKIATSCLLFLILFPSCVSGDHRVYVKGEEIKDLFAYDVDEMKSLLSKLKLERRFKYEPYRNTDGNEIFFVSTGSPDSNMLVLRIDGSFEYSKLPRYPSFVESVDIYSLGKNLYTSFFLYKQNRIKYSNPLYRLKILNFVGISIFFNRMELFVFGYDPNMNSSDNRYPEIYCYIFQQKSGEIYAKEKIIIKRPSKGASPFYVIDMNVKTKDVLFVDVFDPPSISKWYLYNIDKREMKKVGNAQGYGLFLDSDIIKNAIEKLK